MNDKLVEALSKIRELDVEIAKVKEHLSDIVKILDELDEAAKPSLVKQVFNACPTEETETAREIAETIAWKLVHPEFSNPDYK